MSLENYSDGKSVYARLALLLVGWATAGFLLYALATFLPVALLAMIAIAASAIVKLDRFSRKTKSLASFLCAVTCLLTGVCGVALWITHRDEYILERLIFVGLCLGAGLILLDRRADGWS